MLVVRATERRLLMDNFRRLLLTEDEVSNYPKLVSGTTDVIKTVIVPIKDFNALTLWICDANGNGINRKLADYRFVNSTSTFTIGNYGGAIEVKSMVASSANASSSTIGYGRCLIGVCYEKPNSTGGPTVYLSANPMKPDLYEEQYYMYINLTQIPTLGGYGRLISINASADVYYIPA